MSQKNIKAMINKLPTKRTVSLAPANAVPVRGNGNAPPAASAAALAPAPAPGANAGVNTPNTFSIEEIQQKRRDAIKSEKMYIQGTTEGNPVYKVVKDGENNKFIKLEGDKWGEPIIPTGGPFKIINCPETPSMAGGARKSRRQRKQKRKATRKQRK